MRAIRRRTCSSIPASLTNLPPLLARVYAARGVDSPAAVDYSLAGLHQPDSLGGLDAAVQRLLEAVTGGQSICVIGDYDADGATSSALALLALRAMGASAVDFLVPNRFAFGYGLSPEIVEVAAQARPQVIVTVDNGIASNAGVATANAHGIDVIVTDHHLPGSELPAACAIVNPNQPGCKFPSKHLAGVGVIFYLMSALRAKLRECGWFERCAIGAPNMAQFLDLVALGTVADLVALDHNNRILVQQGLRRIRAGQSRPGIRALMQLGGRDLQRTVSADLAFVVAPRINAAGRLDDMSLGIRCLLEEDPGAAHAMAAQLDALNRERRDIESGMQEAALRALASFGDTGSQQLPWGLCLYESDWHQGVVGLVASRLKERHHRPVIAFAPAGEGELKGSGRSVRGFHLRDALAAIDAREPGLITRFGGHAMAAGLSIGVDCFERFAQAFDAEVRGSINAADMEHVIESDGAIAAQEFTLDHAQLLRDAGPWGQRFPEPLFDGEFVLRSQRLVGERHLRMTLAPVDAPDLLLGAIAFNVDTATWPNTGAGRVRIAFRLDVNEYRGERELQLLVEELQSINEQGLE